MYKSNISFTQLNRYLNELIEKGLLKRTIVHGEEVIHYITTEKGRKFIELFAKMQEAMNVKDLAYPNELYVRQSSKRGSSKSSSSYSGT